jgi:hypothetical protein
MNALAFTREVLAVFGEPPGVGHEEIGGLLQPVPSE